MNVGQKRVPILFILQYPNVRDYWPLSHRIPRYFFFFSSVRVIIFTLGGPSILHSNCFFFFFTHAKVNNFAPNRYDRKNALRTTLYRWLWFQVPAWKTLLIEAGEEEHYVMDIPLVANMLQFTDANWKYKTMPSDQYCLGN